MGVQSGWVSKPLSEKRAQFLVGMVDFELRRVNP